MPKNVQRVLLLLSDSAAAVGVFVVWCWLRKGMGFFAASQLEQQLELAAILALFWVVVFGLSGLYRPWYAQSRMDELITVVKAVSFGVVLLLLATADWERDLSRPPELSRMMIVSYWGLMVVGVGTGRVALRTFQRKLLEAGVGVRRTLIVGWNPKARKLYDDLLRYPALGHKVVGFIDAVAKEGKGEHRGCPVLGGLRDLTEVVTREHIEEILIALEGNSRRKTVDVIARCEGLPVNIKIQPDLYDIVTGQMRTNQIYGFPLIEVFPQLMPAWERKAKRALDVLVSVVVLVGFLPLWLLVALLIKLDSRGPVLYKQCRVGKGGKHFEIYKFRSMIVGAEKYTGPVWAGKKDPRVTRVGRIIRRLRIDEVPQFINVLKNDMSLVGPRPERPYFVEKLKRHFRLYTRRLMVKPGITGWAQIKGAYDESLEDVKKKLEYDFYYVENMSLRMDLKIILRTIWVMLTGKGQ
ncbi:MAG: sugar transferase [candidate division KSB1 bacterium]|nr:sugar transferase [candidate division KSB1 bacterium]